jgi:hypothetical protein
MSPTNGTSDIDQGEAGERVIRAALELTVIARMARLDAITSEPLRQMIADLETAVIAYCRLIAQKPQPDGGSPDPH